MQHSFPAQAIDRFRELHYQKKFAELCKAFDFFVGTPSLSMWRGWLDVFFAYDKEWFDAFFHFHQQQPSSATRAIALLLIYRKVVHVRGDTSVRSCEQQDQLLHDMILATHGLLQPLYQDTKYNNAAFVIEALLHTVYGKSLDVQWRMHVVPMLSEPWRMIFLWGQLVIVMAHHGVGEAIDSVLQDCKDHERAQLEPMVQAYLSTDEQLAAGEDVVLFSTDPLCGDIFAIDMAEYCFEQERAEEAEHWIGDRVEHLYDMFNSNEWLTGAMDVLNEYCPQSALLSHLIRLGIQRQLPLAFHLQALECQDNDLLLANAQRGYTDSMVTLAERLHEAGQEVQAKAWLLQAASVYHSEALYLLGGTQSKDALNYLTQAVQRLHPQALFDAALGVLNEELQWKYGVLHLQEEGVAFDPGQAIELLEKSRAAGMEEASILLFDLLHNHVSDESFFALCYAAAHVDSSYVERGYHKALELEDNERIVEWAEKLLKTIGNHEDILFELGLAAYALGRTPLAIKSWTDGAKMGHQPCIEKLELYAQDKLPSAIVPSTSGWQSSWRSLAKKFTRT